MSDPLRPLWDFDDLDATEARFRALRAEALTQLARVEGLRDRFEVGDRLLDEIVEQDARVRIRVDLERGRLRRSAGDKERRCRSSSPRSRTRSRPGRTGSPATPRTCAHWPRPIEKASSRGQRAGSSWPSPRLRPRTGSGRCLNNLGWEYFDAGEHEQALDAFERALDVRLRDPENAAAIEHAREAVAEALKALGRAD